MSVRRILKFEVTPGAIAIATEDEPRFLAVGHQGETVVVWCEATPGVGVQTPLYAVMTGEAPPKDAEYIGTTQFADAGHRIVVHVYHHLPPGRSG